MNRKNHVLSICALFGVGGEGFETAENHLGFSFAFTSLD